MPGSGAGSDVLVTVLCGVAVAGEVSGVLDAHDARINSRGIRTDNDLLNRRVITKPPEKLKFALPGAAEILAHADGVEEHPDRRRDEVVVDQKRVVSVRRDLPLME